jgi:elongation factor Ts
MTTITAAMVKDLRESTGAGMMDCKAALTESGGDMTAAQDWLRKKGLSKAAKKAGRVAAEGLIGALTKATKGVVVEVNSETDFVARNGQFQGLVKMIAQVALDAGADVEKIKATKVGGDRDCGCDRNHRREHDAAPRGLARSRQGRGVELRP